MCFSMQRNLSFCVRRECKIQGCRWRIGENSSPLISRNSHPPFAQFSSPGVDGFGDLRHVPANSIRGARTMIRRDVIVLRERTA